MVYVMDLDLYICKDVLEAIYVFKLILKSLKLKFKIGSYVFVKQVLYIEVLNDFSLQMISSRKTEKCFLTTVI